MLPLILVIVWRERTNNKGNKQRPSCDMLKCQYMLAEYCQHVTSMMKCTIAVQLASIYMKPAIKLHFFLTLMKLHFPTFVLHISVDVDLS